MKFETSDIGARLLDSITRGLYDGNLNCIREYVQNSIDSKAKKIDIYFENGNENLVIKDDARGMTKEGIRSALRLGWSSKTQEDVGWRGIGIWSGVSVCRKMVIITKAKSSEKILLEIDCNKLREEIDKDKDVFEVLSAITGEIESEELGKDESFEESQYTIIRLERILPQLKTIFNKEDVRKYLEDTVPAPFNDNFLNGKKIDEFLLENRVKFSHTDIFFQNEKIFRPPRKIISEFNDFITEKFVIKDEVIAIAWFVTTKTNKKISDDIGGVVFKKKGFTIGDTDLVIKQCKTSYNKWQVGEIHIVSENLRENSSRNNFESADNLEDFLKEVGRFIGQLSTQNRYQSERLVTGYVEKAQKLLDSGKIEAAEKELIKAKEKLLKKNRNFPEELSLAKMKILIDEQSESDKKNINELDILINTTKTTKNPELEENEELMEAKAQFNSFKKGLSKELQVYEKKFSSHGKLDFDISITRPLIDLLQRKTSLTSNEMFELSMEAYGWTKFPKANKIPILTVDSQMNDKSNKPSELNRIQFRNMEFGVMIHAIHDLLVNLKKHKQGHPTLGWFENATEVQKYRMMIEIYAIIDFIYRLIEQSEIYQQ